MFRKWLWLIDEVVGGRGWRFDGQLAVDCVGVECWCSGFLNPGWIMVYVCDERVVAVD